MAHDHSHDNAEDRQAYFLDQLCTIGICGGLGAVMILLYYAGALITILHPKFHLPVLWGGIALLIIVALRAVAVWLATATPAENHDHEACEHNHCDHDH